MDHGRKCKKQNPDPGGHRDEYFCYIREAKVSWSGHKKY